MSSKGILQNFDKFQNGIARVEKAFGIFAMAFIVVINIYGISSRYIFNTPVIYVQELTILAAVWLFFVGMGLVFKAHADIVVELAVRLFPRRVRLIHQLFADFVILFFVVITAWATYKFIPFTRTEVHVMSFALGLPDETYFYPIGLGAISIFLTVFHDAIGHVTQFRLKWKAPPDEALIRQAGLQEPEFRAGSGEPLRKV